MVLDDESPLATNGGPAFGHATLFCSEDWDVIDQSVAQLCMCSSGFKLCHVKSHQDNDTPYDELDLSVRLNLDSDNLAV
eukprot:15364623-Ditylum_brightwellii.AAC.1